MKIKKGDKVKVLSGRERSKTGDVIQVLYNKQTRQHYVVVEGIHTLKKHVRAGQRADKGQIIELPSPMQMSNVMLIDPKTSKPTRVQYKQEGTDKKRMARVSGEFID